MANDLPTPAPNLEKFAAKAAGMDIETPTPVTNMEKYLDAIAKGGGGTSDYTDLTNKPQINGVTLSGNKTASDIGCASLVDGKVPASELPSYVDDVVEYASAASFPATGEQGKIYVALDSNKCYRWSGSEYIPILSLNIWEGTRQQYEALQSDDYDYYFVTEAVSSL